MILRRDDLAAPLHPVRPKIPHGRQLSGRRWFRHQRVRHGPWRFALTPAPVADGSEVIRASIAKDRRSLSRLNPLAAATRVGASPARISPLLALRGRVLRMTGLRRRLSVAQKNLAIHVFAEAGAERFARNELERASAVRLSFSP
jgi:hypothetical protein